MSKECLGCGVTLQDDNLLQEGYTTNIENNICNRCFRIKNYGEYQVVTKSNQEYLDIIKEVGQTKDLVLYVTDLLNLEEDLSNIRKYISNNMILVLNKRDVLPKSLKDGKIVKYFKDLDIVFNDIIVISAIKNYNIDYLLKRIKYFQTSKNVYVVGHTNAGKSTLINKLIKNYSESERELTISPLPSTTLNCINITINDYLTIIDTPGLLDMTSFVNYVDAKELKRITPKKEIKPKTYQLRQGQSLLIGEYVRVDYVGGEKNSFTVFVSNDIKIKRFINPRHQELKNLAKREFSVKYNEDLVISGLGFIKIVNKAQVDVYTINNVNVFTRSSII